MRIFVTGTRGIPTIPGGIESHCEMLYPLIVKMGHEVRLSRRSRYVVSGSDEWSGVSLVDNYSPKSKGLEALFHTFIAIIEAKKWKADIIHIHAIGPALMSPLARLLGLKVVMTNHGPDYDRDKWGAFAKFILKLGERIGSACSNEIIVISEVIRSIIQERYNKPSNLIYNGVQLPNKTSKTDFIESLGLTANNYILAVARFVPEKGLHDLIQAFEQSGLDCKLVLAGDCDHDDKYSRSLKAMAAANPNIVLTGYITGHKLNEIFSHANIFALPSYHEGLPIALLEALSYGLTPVISNIPSNLEVPLNAKYFFQCKDIKQLASKLNDCWNIPEAERETQSFVDLVKNKYNWPEIAKQTVAVYEKLKP